MGKTMYQSELDAIRSLRDAFPNEGPKKFANRIHARGFDNADHKKLAANTQLRTILSIYSVIRRHDASKKKLATA
jgi:hypothetical protein